MGGGATVQSKEFNGIRMYVNKRRGWSRERTSDLEPKGPTPSTYKLIRGDMSGSPTYR